MSKEEEKKPNNVTDQDTAVSGACASTGDAAPTEEPSDGPDEGTDMPPELADLAGEEPAPDYKLLAAELNDRLLRAVAELENYRRRAEKERQDTAKFAITGFARDSLTVLDNLRRGLDSVTSEDRDGNPVLEALAAGMELTEREVIATLERHGIEKVDPLGAPFDYDRHQAMFEVDDPNQPAGTVVEVMQPGYLLSGRLLRPAMVGVAKGGPKREEIRAPIAKEDHASATDAAEHDREVDVKPTPNGKGSGTDETPDDADGHVDTKV